MSRPDVPFEIVRLAEAFIFASPGPVTPHALQPLLPDHLDPMDVLFALQSHCSSRGVVLFEIGGAWMFRTAPDLGGELRKVLTEPHRLPRSAMEILVIIALNQPVTRPEIENIRGVTLSQHSMDVLLEAGLIESAGRKEVAGRPTLWVTTSLFLSRFGLRSLQDVPGADLGLSPEHYAPAPSSAKGAPNDERETPEPGLEDLDGQPEQTP